MALQWEPDRNLQVRMALVLVLVPVLVLVLVLPVAFVYAFVFLTNTVGVELLSFATEREWRGRFYVEPWLVVVAVAVGFTAQYFPGERSALRAGGQLVGVDSENGLAGPARRTGAVHPGVRTLRRGRGYRSRQSREVRGYWQSQLRR
jgi:hypothetical protein